MTASSHQTPGPMPPEYPPAATPEQAAAVFAAYGAVLPVPLGSAYVDPVGAAAGVLTAAMSNGAATAQELAQAEADAGLLFDPRRAQDIAAASAERAHAEDEAELAERGRQLAEMAGAHRQVAAVGRLIEGRPGWHLLSVAEIAAAVEYAKTAHDGSPPMTLTWTGTAEVPDAHEAHKQVVIACVSSYGGRADLLVEGDARTKLASLLDTGAIRDINAPCSREPACGTDGAMDPTDVFGWFHLDVAGLAGGPRWYCSPGCVNAAMVRAGDDLALADQAAAVDSGEHAYDEASYLDARYGLGASDEYAVQQAGAVEAGFQDERGDIDEERAL
ncbi:hypothetical protein JHN63_15040 [Streptomyces sp. MBT65]|uniref:hypothetical protein n=1 Tax=Streptomyces sp. MBT65 TaxID=1488395 RepID=UPI00190D4BD0|nr:hypothetical protein [Streptomyces sp. MBT65]MBK3575103.1 hypothetical protein [Streptomyces sp. MBT65]